MFPHQGGHGQLPPHWQQPTSQPPTNGSYPPPTHTSTSHSFPPPDPRPDMTAQPPQYRLPGPLQWSQGPPPDAYRGRPPPPSSYLPQHHQPPAPRQRTAIACRYCRRRKIRCTGFEATDDGRCTNCMRFNQDCIFTPVSAQAQAFVPVQTVWRGVGNPPPLYGAYGQPLPPAGHAEAYGPSTRPQGYLPSPTGASPATSSAPYASGPPHASAQPYYGAAQQQPPRRTSPQGAYPYDLNRTSSSPSSQAPTTPGVPYYAAPAASSSALQQPVFLGNEGSTPPPPSRSSISRPSMRINDLVSDSGHGRSSTDSNMLNMLNRRPM